MKAKIQHEFDHEPTYVVGENDKELVTLSPEISVEVRQKIAEYAKRMIETPDDYIYDVWSIDDVIGQAENEDLELTEDQAREVLAKVKDKHDANIGINWETISYWIREVAKEN